MTIIRFAVVFVLISFVSFSDALADFAEECLSEGCNDEEVNELYSSYRSECIDEGCSHEEVIELAGGPQHVDAMLQEFRRRGFEVLDNSPGPNCQATGSRTSCVFVANWCQDWYFCPGGTDSCADDPFCPGGNTSNAYYLCGACFGFDF
jgi:hypothetical protein